MFAQLSLCEQRSLRLVCKAWDETVREVMRNMKSVAICLDEESRDREVVDYRFTNKEHLMPLLERHANVRKLMIVKDYRDREWRVEALTSKVASLQRLEYLRISGMVVPAQFYQQLGNLSRLVSLEFFHCNMPGVKFGYLSGSIRKIKLHNSLRCECPGMLEGMRILHARGIPLQEFRIEFGNLAPTSLHLLQFMLENFASLRVLALDYINYEPEESFTHAPFQPLRAVDIEKLILHGYALPASYRRQLFAALLAQPLPNLHTLGYEFRTLRLKEVTLNQFWNMCPKLDKLKVSHRCKNKQCLERLKVAHQNYISENLW